MIEISRSVIRSFRSVLKKIHTVPAMGGAAALVVFRADRTGVHIQARGSEIALEYAQPGAHAGEAIAIPAEALADFQSRQDTPLHLEGQVNGVLATWQEKAVPQMRRYDVVRPDQMPEMPAFPARSERQPVELLAALRDASATAGEDGPSYSMNCLQLRGKSGSIASTDGKQLLMQTGYKFGWTDDILIPASQVFACRELYGQEPISIGRTDKCVTLTIGPWTLHLSIEKDRRFPNVANALAGVRNAPTEVQFDPGDAAFLIGNLDSLPGAKSEFSPLTIDGNGQVIVRAKDDEQPTTTEVVLARSTTQGTPAAFATNRYYLERALRLGFAHIGVTDAEHPVLCRDEKRQYIWQVLGKEALLAASENPIRLSSAADLPASPPVPAPATAPPSPAVGEATPPAAPQANGKVPVQDTPPHETAANGSERAGITGLLAEAEAIKDVLRDVLSRAHQHCANVKRYRKQAQFVRTALGSLRQLQEVAD